MVRSLVYQAGTDFNDSLATLRTLTYVGWKNLQLTDNDELLKDNDGRPLVV